MKAQTEFAERFSEACRRLPERFGRVLTALPEDVRSRTFEIRMRAGQPVTLTVPGDPLFVTPEGEVRLLPQGRLLTTRAADLEEIFACLCEWSVYARQNEIREGFVTLRGGHRAGICGTAVLTDGVVTGVRDISSVNLRIARAVPGAGAEAHALLREMPDGGLLIAGAPGSGKTTVLRDLARLLAGGAGTPAKVAVIDERCELAAVHRGESAHDLGLSDVLSGFPKAEGIRRALRTLSPDFVLLDEIGSDDEVDRVREGLNSGVRFAATVHAGGRDDLLRRPAVRKLLACGAFRRVLLLKNARSPGTTAQRFETEALLREMGGFGADHRRGYGSGIDLCPQPAMPGGGIAGFAAIDCCG